MTSTITNAGTAAAGEVSSITLGNAGSGKTNAVTLNGTVDTYNVTGGTGNDTVAFGAADTIKNGTFSLGAGTADTVDFSALAIANTGANAEGLAMNFSSSTVTFGEGYANVTTLASGKVAAYDSTYFAGSTTAANKAIIADGQNFTLSGVEVVVGSAEADYIALSNTGMTVTGGAGNDKIVAGAGTDIIDMTGAIAGLGSDSVSSFAIATDTFKFTGENIGDGNTTLTFTKAAAASAAALSELNVFTTALADDAAVIAAIQTVTSTTPSLFVVYNTADGEAQVWYDASASADGGETQLVSLVGVTAADIDNITVSNFVTLV